MVAGGYSRDGPAPVSDTAPVHDDDPPVPDDEGVQLTRRTSGFLVAAGAWPLVVWPNFVRVVATDDRAFDDGPTAYLVVHVTLAVVSMALGLALVVVGVRGWRSARH